MWSTAAVFGAGTIPPRTKEKEKVYPPQESTEIIKGSASFGRRVKERVRHHCQASESENFGFKKTGERKKYYYKDRGERGKEQTKKRIK